MEVRQLDNMRYMALMFGIGVRLPASAGVMVTTDIRGAAWRARPHGNEPRPSGAGAYDDSIGNRAKYD
jgi:hypothetical protein